MSSGTRARVMGPVAAILLVAAQLPCGGAQVSVPVRGIGSADPEMVVPTGTVISIVLTSYLNTRSTLVGDKFYADTVYPVWIQQRLVIPKGSTVRGRVTQVFRPGRIKGKGRLAVQVDEILLPNGVRRDLVAAFQGIHGPGDEKIDRTKETVEAGGNRGADAGQVLSTTGQGAIIGAIAGRGSGAGIGAGVGAAVGLGAVLFTRGKDLVLQPGTQFDLELKQPLRFAFGEVDFTAQQLNSAHQTPAPRPYYDQNRNRSNNPRRGIGIPWPFIR